MKTLQKNSRRFRYSIMKKILPSLYELKKAVLLPRTMYVRRKFKAKTGFAKAAMELHYYRPSFLKFMGATMMDKHILHDADLEPDSVVIDVGAFNGSWAQNIIERYDPIIYAFEPNTKSYSALAEKAENNPKLKILPYGLGEEDEMVEFTINGKGSSMYEDRTRHAELARETVEIRAIDRVWKELKIGQVDLMKINIEGAEFPLLEKMIEADLLGNVDSYMIQFHEWHPGAYGRRRRIRKELSKTHRLLWDYHFVWEKWVRL